MDENNGRPSVSPAKLEANRRNARRSTGPKTPKGKLQSRRNALKHGILASDWLIREGDSAEDAAAFDELLAALCEDLAPVGALEEILVGKIAVCHWRQNRALRCEGELTRQILGHEVATIYRALQFNHPDSRKAKTLLSLPLDDRLDRIIRCETSAQRQLVYAINQLERLQRTRTGEHVPAPVTVQVSSDP